MGRLKVNSTGPAAITVIIAVITAIAFYGFLHYPTLLAVPAMILIPALALIIIHFRLQAALAKIISLLLPFSLEVPFFQGSMISLPAEPLILLVAMVLFLEIAGRPMKTLNTPLHREFLWLTPLAAAFLVTISFSEILLVSVKFSFINLLYILVFFVFLARMFRQNRNLFFQMLLLYSIGLAIVMLWSIYRFWLWEWNPVVISGIFQPFYNDHTIFGAAAAMLTAIWLSTTPKGKNNISRLAWLLPGMLFFGAVLLSTSRAAFLSLLIFIVIIVMLALRLRVKYLLLMAGSMAVIMVLFHRQVSERLGRIEALSYESQSGLAERTLSAGNISTDVSNVERLNRWVSAWRMFKERPLTGFGPGTYQFTYIPYQEPALMNRLTVTKHWEAPKGSGGTAHSEYLLALSEMGILGLAGWLIFIGRLTFISFDLSRRHPSRMIIAAAFAALSTYFFHALFNNFLNTDKFAFLFWGTGAWLISNYHSKNERDILPAD